MEISPQTNSQETRKCSRCRIPVFEEPIFRAPVCAVSDDEHGVIEGRIGAARVTQHASLIVPVQATAMRNITLSDVMFMLS